MTVLVSLLTLVPGGMGGSETYARELLRELSQSDLEVTTLVSPLSSDLGVGLPERVAAGFSIGHSGPARAAAVVHAGLRRRKLRRYLAGAEVVHYPLTVPLPVAGRDQRTIVTIHDVQHRDLPGLFSGTEKFYRRLAYDRAAARADAVITISQFCKQRLVSTLGLDPARVHVAPLGVRATEFTPHLGPRDPFLLYPAKGWPHKNHARLLTAFEILRARHPSMRLVLTGVRGDELPAVPAGVEVRGLVPRAELVELYRRASALVFPSLYEGFGLPPLEAMASGCPVAAARAGSLPEVVGDAAVLFDPQDPEAIATGVEQALDTASDLQPRGLAHARQFPWSECARIHEGIYRDLGG